MHARAILKYSQWVIPLFVVGIILIAQSPVNQQLFAAIETDDIAGAVYIEGDENEVTWDDDGIALWEAEGNVYLRFTSTEGEVFELWGSRLVYSSEGDEHQNRKRISIQGDVRLSFGVNNLSAGSIIGYLSPLDLEAAEGVKLIAGAFEITTHELQLTESPDSGAEMPRYVASVAGDEESEVIFQREPGETRETVASPNSTAIPLPVDINPDFSFITANAFGFEIIFHEEEIISAEFPNGAVAMTDTGYSLTQSKLRMNGIDEIIATECRMIGPDVDIQCNEMTFFPDQKSLELSGDIILCSDEGSLRVDFLTILYDDYGVKELRARGDVNLDFSVCLIDEPGPDESIEDDNEQTESGGGSSE